MSSEKWDYETRDLMKSLAPSGSTSLFLNFRLGTLTPVICSNWYRVASIQAEKVNEPNLSIHVLQEFHRYDTVQEMDFDESRALPYFSSSIFDIGLESPMMSAS